MKYYIIGILAAILLVSPSKGFGGTPSPKQITEWRSAAAKGYADAQYNLGVMYSLGEGVPQNYAEALKWLRLAAQQGHAEALSSISEECTRWAKVYRETMLKRSNGYTLPLNRF